MAYRTIAQLSPGRIILLSLFVTMVLGTGALALPFSRLTPIPLIDLFFTAASATCVTGLFTVPLDQFTTIGHFIIMLLVQIGGLGLITMMLFFLSLFIELGLSTQIMAGKILELESWKNIRKVILFIIVVTLTAEILGMFCILPFVLPYYSLTDALFLSLFHAVSSFCSAGINIFDIHTPYLLNANNILLIITTILMFVGGLGFITWYELMEYLYGRFTHKRFRFSLHSKIILYGSIVTVIATGSLFWILEHANVLAPFSMSQTLITTIFHAVSFRSTGFLLFDLKQLQLATIMVIMAVSFIGSAPGSTGSGIKITTFTIFLATITAAISGKTAVQLRGRRIALDQVLKAVAIISLSLFWVLLITFCLLITEPRWFFIDLLFEAMTAFSNLGITTGVTPTLSLVGKLCIVASMIVGRIGSFTLILALKLRSKKEVTEISYPEERVMIG